MDKLFDHITENNTEDYIAGKVDEYKSEYVWDWEDDFEDIHEAYEEQGRGQAESQILNEVVVSAMTELGQKLNTEQYCDLVDALAEHYGIIPE